jgi:Na+/melibiose symporter-like transporter
MGFSADDWMHAHMGSVLWMVEVFWVAGFLAVFVCYFMIKRRIKKKKTATAEKNKPIE